jgi:hypothetical protein
MRQYLNALIPGRKGGYVTIITGMIASLMKDRTASVLSTDCATKLNTICAKIRFCSHVKAVNGNSSEGFYQLSHFSVDNMV